MPTDTARRPTPERVNDAGTEWIESGTGNGMAEKNRGCTLKISFNDELRGCSNQVLCALVACIGGRCEICPYPLVPFGKSGLYFFICSPKIQKLNCTDMSDIKSKVTKIIVDKLGVDESDVTLEANFTNDLGADSLDTVELIMEFEKEFNIAIPDDQAEKIGTVGQAVEYIEKNTN